MRLFHDLFYGTRPKEEQNMAIEQVKAYLKGYGLADRIREFEESSATVELAAHAVDCKKLVFQEGGSCLDHCGGGRRQN